MTRFRYSMVRNLSSMYFDRQLKQRQRSIRLEDFVEGQYYDYLREESARQIVDRIEDISRKFPIALELGCYRGALGQLVKELPSSEGKGGVGGIEQLVQCDIAQATGEHLQSMKTSAGGVESYFLQVDEEFLPFKEDSFDLVLSSLSLHWVNDLPAALTQIKSVLKPDGAFIASFLGGETLRELRHCFYLAEQERKGGLSPHTSPMLLGSDIAALMQASGFALPTVDIEKVQISYPDAFTLMEHIYKMGEGNSALNRQFNVGRDTFLSMASIYQHLYGLEDNSVTATFEMVYVIGWKPDSSQPKACKRGSAKVSMKNIANTSNS